MEKLTIADAAAHFKISKEAINSRIRRGTLRCLTEGGVKYVLLGGDDTPAKPAPCEHQKYYDHLEQENARLQAKIGTLEAEIQQLREARESSLISEREKIEAIYKERDEQLKSILRILASPVIGGVRIEEAMEAAKVPSPRSTPVLHRRVVHEEDEIEEDIVIESITDKPDPFADDEFDDLVTLKDFMRLKDYSKKRRQRIKERFKARAAEDARILVREGRLYLRPYHYDYGDLLE